MDAAGYTTLTRQTSLMREMQIVANNIANISTTGFRREGLFYSEYIQDTGEGPSLSMANGDVRHVDLSQAGLNQTGGTFDFAIQGEGFFLIATPEGEKLTRSGSFTVSPEGSLVTNDGFALLDLGRSAISVPAGAKTVTLAEDGTISSDGVAFAGVGLWAPVNAETLRHSAGTMFSASEIEPVTGASLLQGHLEESNVNAVTEIARMIEVQRTYELGQGFLDREDQRMRSVIQTLGR
jgi:flagellar basal-body rod protein FlgF